MLQHDAVVTGMQTHLDEEQHSFVSSLQQDFFIAVTSSLQQDEAQLALQPSSLQHVFFAAILGGQQTSISVLTSSSQHDFCFIILSQQSMFSSQHDFAAGGSLLQIPSLLQQGSGAVLGDDTEQQEQQEMSLSFEDCFPQHPPPALGIVSSSSAPLPQQLGVSVETPQHEGLVFFDTAIARMG